MNFADYNRDGLSAKFLVQVGTMPCGKHQFAAVGITKANPHLHALASVAHPKTPLMMPLNAWQALLKSPDPTVVSIWDCGDHGSEERREFVVSADSGDIRVKDRLFSCPADNQPEMLVEETDE